MMNRIHHLKQKPNQAIWVREKREKEKFEEFGIQSFSIEYKLPLPHIQFGNASPNIPPLGYNKEPTSITIQKK